MEPVEVLGAAEEIAVATEVGAVAAETAAADRVETEVAEMEAETAVAAAAETIIPTTLPRQSHLQKAFDDSGIYGIRMQSLPTKVG